MGYLSSREGGIKAGMEIRYPCDPITEYPRAGSPRGDTQREPR
jgi:hypothetical protein